MNDASLFLHPLLKEDKKQKKHNEEEEVEDEVEEEVEEDKKKSNKDEVNQKKRFSGLVQCLPSFVSCASLMFLGRCR